jgi:hypothetical protein
MRFKQFRYTFTDPYILEELTRAYKRADVKGRIDLLNRFSIEDETIPYELALQAVEDQSVEIREWIARFSRHLDYSDHQWVDDQEVVEHPERNLEQRLLGDADPFVRACLRENPAVFGHSVGDSLVEDKWKKIFRDSTHLERLALVRNPVVDTELIETIFDHEEQELGLTFEERKQLVAAFLTNENAVSRSYDTSREYRGEYIFADADHFSKLWRLISKWEIQKTDNVSGAVYRMLGAPDTTKAEIYKICNPEDFRRYILENCTTADVETLRLGAQDTDQYRREYAEKLLEEAEDMKSAGKYAMFLPTLNKGKSISEKLDAIGVTLLDFVRDRGIWKW